MAAEREELNYQYSPSRWSPRLPADVIVEAHCAVTLAATKKARETLTCDLGIHYVTPSGGPALDVYHSSASGPLSDTLFVFYHGGYWEAMGVEYSGGSALSLAKYGATVVAVGYTLAPKANMTTIVEECRKSVLFVHKKFPDKSMYVAGHSAGAQLAANLMTTNWGQYGIETIPICGSILVSGVYDLSPLQKMYCNDSLNLTSEEIAQFSPQLNGDQLARLPAGFQTLVVWGEHESDEFKRQSREFSQELEKRGVACTSHELGGLDHFQITEDLQNEDYELTQMIVKLMSTA